MVEKETYLDNAATCKPLPSVIDVVAQTMGEGFGNASARHARGRRAHELLEESRAVVAEALGVEPDEVFFTSGGTESNNLAIVGACKAVSDNLRLPGKVITSTVEHPSVAKSVRGVKREGWNIGYIPAKNGEFDFEELRRELTADTTLITCMRVQNEVGFILPVDKVAQVRDELAPGTLLHTDGVQAFGKIDFQPKALGADLAGISAHKIGGPQGVGALYVKRGTPMFTTAFGGGQEKGLRSGTEPLPLIAGFAEAVRQVFATREENEQRIAALKQHLLQGVVTLCPDVHINSREDGSPFVVSFSVPGVDGAHMLTFMDENGIRLSKSSACKTLHPDVPAEDWKGKHAISLVYCGVPGRLVESTLRISFSAQSTRADVDAFLVIFGEFLRLSRK